MNGCIDPFEPEVKPQASKALVVDGFINSNGRTTIKLSHTYDLASTNGPVTEDKAQVLIQGEGSGEEYLLREVKLGTYVSDSLVLNPATQYRLFFRTRNSRKQFTGQYASSYEAVKTSPPIEALTWKVVPRGLELYANTFDATGQSIYYRWDYTETWEFTSAGQSYFVYENHKMRRRRAEEDIYTCWQTVHSPTIKLTSTKRLSEDRVTEFPLLEFPAGDTRLRYKYSVLVRQYTMGAEEYAYWEALKKNTETIGSLFDPLPSQSTGNVRNLNQPQEPVLGFVGVGSVTQKRIFIVARELPQWSFTSGYESCGYLPEDVAPPVSLEEMFGSGENIPMYLYDHEEYGLIFRSYPVECADCRVRGSKVRPPFWD
ncbi:DUF4249 domain-containing protein [Hymenobacter sp. DG25A]|uniref:DUF4249 domain-containing protein n=1 Tax=Hymenobacter sp. DG25A TaxID=1385663 RepID=UPI001E511BFF|nr:DUF4249 domain-containing protein [Hymenobacter sp. DG25A]